MLDVDLRVTAMDLRQSMSESLWPSDRVGVTDMFVFHNSYLVSVGIFSFLLTQPFATKPCML